jgi:hypothetical protein
MCVYVCVWKWLWRCGLLYDICQPWSEVVMNGLHWVSHHKTPLTWISVTPLLLFHRLLWNMNAEILLSANNVFIFIYRTVYNHLLLLQPTLYILVTWDFVHWVMVKWKSSSSLFYKSTPHCFLHHCIDYTQIWLLECLLRIVALSFYNSSHSFKTLLLIWTLEFCDDMHFLSYHVILNI